MIDHPVDWRRGELLNVRQYGDGSFAATRLGEEFDYQALNGVRFASGADAQAFVSWWYAPIVVREREA